MGCGLITVWSNATSYSWRLYRSKETSCSMRYCISPGSFNAFLGFSGNLCLKNNYWMHLNACNYMHTNNFHVFVSFMMLCSPVYIDSFVAVLISSWVCDHSIPKFIVFRKIKWFFGQFYWRFSYRHRLAWCWRCSDMFVHQLHWRMIGFFSETINT